MSETFDGSARAERESWVMGRGDVLLYMLKVEPVQVGDHYERRPVAIATKIETTLLKFDGAQTDPAYVRLTNERAQELMDDLWRCGVRPSEGSGSVGQLAATERHLADMRMLAGVVPGVSTPHQK